MSGWPESENIRALKSKASQRHSFYLKTQQVSELSSRAGRATEAANCWFTVYRLVPSCIWVQVESVLEVLGGGRTLLEHNLV